MDNTPQYCTDLYNQLSIEHSVEYYAEIDGEYTTVDCFVIDGYCIKLDRMNVNVLSESTFQVLLDAVYALLEELKQKMIELGHTV